MQASGDTSLLDNIEKQEEQTAKQISRITGTGMRREGLFGGGTPLKHVSQSGQCNTLCLFEPKSMCCCR